MNRERRRQQAQLQPVGVVDLGTFAPLFMLEGIDFFSLQKGPRAADITAFGLSERIVDLDRHLSDFTDTAAAVSVLDLVVSVDTAVVHLAGALGRPVWTLLPLVPDWRARLGSAKKGLKVGLV